MRGAFHRANVSGRLIASHFSNVMEMALIHGDTRFVIINMTAAFNFHEPAVIFRALLLIC